MAIEDFGGQLLGHPIELLSADHQNKPDVGVGIARRWFESQGVDMVNDLLNSAVALAVVNQAKQSGRIAIVNGAGTTRITNEDCTPNSIHYAWDTYALSQSVARAVIKQGGDTWFFITADYAGGHSQEREATDVVQAAGGRVVGRATHPQDAPDFASYILMAQGSGAKVVALANGATDTVNAIKQAGTFGLTQGGQTLVPLAFFIPGRACPRPGMRRRGSASSKDSTGTATRKRAPSPGASCRGPSRCRRWCRPASIHRRCTT